MQRRAGSAQVRLAWVNLLGLYLDQAHARDLQGRGASTGVVMRARMTQIQG